MLTYPLYPVHITYCRFHILCSYLSTKEEETDRNHFQEKLSPSEPNDEERVVPQFYIMGTRLECPPAEGQCPAHLEIMHRGLFWLFTQDNTASYDGHMAPDYILTA